MSALFKIDLHVHTKHSGDNTSEPEDMIESAIERGLNAIAFTEHNYYGLSEFADGLNGKYSGKIVALRGVEISAHEGHCLVFGVDTDRMNLNGIPMADVIKTVNKSGGVVIPSHPFRNGSGVGNLINDLNGICAVEGFNGANLHTMNIAALALAASLELPCTGGSDAHEPEHVGSCHTEFVSEVNKENFIDMLKSGGYKGFDGRKISRLAKFSYI